MRDLSDELKARAVRNLQPTRVTGGLPRLRCLCGGEFGRNFCTKCGAVRHP